MSDVGASQNTAFEDRASTGAANSIAMAEDRARSIMSKTGDIHSALEVLIRCVEAESPTGVLGSILLMDSSGEHLHHGAAPSLPQAYNDAIHGIKIGPDVGSCGTAAYSGHAVLVNDIQAHPLWKNFKGLADEHGRRSCWSTPIISKDRRVLGTFALYHRIPNVPTSQDRENVERLAATAAELIEQHNQHT